MNHYNKLEQAFFGALPYTDNPKNHEIALTYQILIGSDNGLKEFMELLAREKKLK